MKNQRVERCHGCGVVMQPGEGIIERRVGWNNAMRWIARHEGCGTNWKHLHEANIDKLTNHRARQHTQATQTEKE